MDKISKLSVDCIRALAIDTINKANSGHPGMALDAAPILYTLYTRHLISDPNDSQWMNRDRFVLSAGHASSLLYVLLYLGKFGTSIEDLKQFRQLNSLTPGHPECDVTKGVDATSGPLGQGIAQAVGMAMAETMLQAQYKDGEEVFNHYTYCLCGDGCLQEGISQEAISYAGLQKLNKLILLYDCNDVTLDGPLSNSNVENVIERFKACNWNTIEVKDGNDVDSIDAAIKKAKLSKTQPTLIKINTIIGYGSQNQGTCKVHGSPLGEADGQHAKDSYGYHYQPFEVPSEVIKHFEETFVARGVEEHKKWQKQFEKYSVTHPEDAKKIVNFKDNDVSSYLFDEIPSFEQSAGDSTRNESQVMLNLLNKSLPNLVGGSADVAKSVMTLIKDETDYTPSNRKGRNINFGIREFAMASIANGILLHKGLRTYIGCFLVFSDYMKSAIRMASLSKLPSLFLFSHDSIAVGEDGPTHQPIEQLAMLRSIPNLNVFRPCDAKELASSYKLALSETHTPSCLILSRQKLPNLANTNFEGVAKGAYIVSKEAKKNQFTIIATGSEVSLAIEAQTLLLEQGIDTRVVSMPCMELFDKQSQIYKESVLGNCYDKCIACEMLSSFGWHKYARYTMSIDEFGRSAKDKDVINYFKFNAESLVKKIKQVL